MKIYNCYFSEIPKEYIAFLEQCKWSAAKFFADIIKEKTYEKHLGEKPTAFFLLDGENIVSFCTLSQKDVIDDEKLSPWIGFVYTSQQYRGNSYSKIVIDQALKIAKSKNCERVYLATDHIGLYEKFGFEYLENRIDVWNENSRIYYFDLNKL